MATIFQQALKELDEVKQGLSRSNAVLFKQAIAAADKAEDALKAFVSASATASESLAEMLKVQEILSGKPAKGSRGGSSRQPSTCAFCDKPALGGRLGRRCDDHRDKSKTELAAALKKKAA